MLRDVMIDIEGLGQRGGSAIFELAAVIFDLDTGELGAEFHVNVVPRLPFLADFETVKWHEKHGTVIEREDAVDPVEAARRFLAWLDLHVPDRDQREMWSWGITYDYVLLEPYLDLRAAGEPEPWKYSQTRDARTIWKTVYRGTDKKRAPRPHEAIEDAKAAILDLVEAWHSVRPPIPFVPAQ